jgi:signal transduction histidine kinase
LIPKKLLDPAIREVAPLTTESEYHLKQDQEVILSGKTKIIPEHSLTDQKGNKCFFYSVKVPFTVAGTNEKAVLDITMDITEQKDADAERTKMVADIVQRNKDLEQFSYIISHNLRAPVANILGLVNILQTIGFDKEEEKNVIGYLSTSAQNLDNVIIDINHILDLQHEVNEKKESIQFASLLNEIKLSIINVINDGHVQINSDFSKVGEISAIKTYLYSIFYNLISNSIKYRRHDIAPIIDITSAVVNNKIQLIFKDNGLGIDLKRKRGEIFGLYKRFHDHVEGKGMGLFMVKTQVQTLGGTIAIASEVNQGTTFTMEFDVN